MKIQTCMTAGHGQLIGQDRLLALGTILSGGQWRIETEALPDGCYGIFDGVGGLAGGAEAAHFAASQLAFPPPVDEGGLRALLIAISEALMNTSGATTATGIYRQAGQTLLFHTGNTRLWGFDGKYLAQLTTDQTLVEEMAQTLSPQESEAVSHVITGCLGGRSAAAAHRVVVEAAGRSLKRYPVLMFTCDGVHETLAPSQLEAMLREKKTAEDVVAQAVAAGAQDDCSVMIMEMT